MNSRVIGSFEALESVRAEWLHLWQNCPTATPFQSPQWLLPWTRHLFGGGAICALAIREGNTLTGFAPLFRWGTGCQTISFLGAGISDYGDILFAAGHEAECVSAVRSFLGSNEMVDLQEIRPSSGLRDAFPSEECSICPVLPLGTFPNCMDSKHRTDVRRARNKLAKDPGFRMETVITETLDAGMSHFFSLHEARWGTLSRELRLFHREVAQNFLESGNLRLSLLHSGNQPAAAVYAFTSGKTLYCYLSGFSPAMAKLSPGAVLLGWVIEQAVSEGMEEVDFLRDGEAYKYLWGARNRTNYRIRGRLA